MVASGSSQLAPVTETAIDDDYELIHVQPPARHHHHHHHHPAPSDAADLDPRAQSPAMDQPVICLCQSVFVYPTAVSTRDALKQREVHARGAKDTVRQRDCCS